MKKGIKIFLLIVILMIIIFIVNVIIKKINNNSQSNQEVDLVYDYPKTFDQYLGENKRAVEVKMLITAVRSSNIVLNYSSNQTEEIEEREEIKCYFNGELLDEVTIQIKISNEYTYKVEAEYNENGKIIKIMINQERKI